MGLTLFLKTDVHSLQAKQWLKSISVCICDCFTRLELRFVQFELLYLDHLQTIMRAHLKII